MYLKLSYFFYTVFVGFQKYWKDVFRLEFIILCVHSCKFSCSRPILKYTDFHTLSSVLFSDEEKVKCPKSLIFLSQMIKPCSWLSGRKIRFLSQLIWVTMVKFFLTLHKSDLGRELLCSESRYVADSPCLQFFQKFYLKTGSGRYWISFSSKHKNTDFD